MEWISVKDKIPEKGVDLILCIEGEVYVGALSEIEENYFLTYEYENYYFFGNPNFEKVTHWMYLPKPPKDK